MIYEGSKTSRALGLPNYNYGYNYRSIEESGQVII